MRISNIAIAMILCALAVGIMAILQNDFTLANLFFVVFGG